MKRRQPKVPEGEIETSASPVIGFRLDEKHRRLLMQRAAEADMSVGDLARVYVIDTLDPNNRLNYIVFALTNLGRDLEELRVDLALSVQTLLASAGKIDPAEAMQWVDQNLKTECSQSPDQDEASAAPITA